MIMRYFACVVAITDQMVNSRFTGFLKAQGAISLPNAFECRTEPSDKLYPIIDDNLTNSHAPRLTLRHIAKQPGIPHYLRKDRVGHALRESDRQTRGHRVDSLNRAHQGHAPWQV